MGYSRHSVSRRVITRLILGADEYGVVDMVVVYRCNREPQPRPIKVGPAEPFRALSNCMFKDASVAY